MYAIGRIVMNARILDKVVRGRNIHAVISMMVCAIMMDIDIDELHKTPSRFYDLRPPTSGVSQFTVLDADVIGTIADVYRFIALSVWVKDQSIKNHILYVWL
jgi:hypothetical protein